MHLIGLDIGTTGCKAALFTMTGRCSPVPAANMR